MKSADSEQGHESLYLEINAPEERQLPLHTSITLFLLSYCDCRSFRVFLVSARADGGRPRKGLVPEGLGAAVIQTQDLPVLVRSCCLPAVLDGGGGFCRAGLAVVLRHIISRTCEREPGRRDVAALLGFKKTCLKACAEVSQWTRLCELGIPSAMEEFLREPDAKDPPVPAAILLLERKLSEPVKVHNDDKIRRQKLQLQQKKASSSQEAPAPESLTTEVPEGLELSAALAKLSVADVQSSSTRGPSDIRKVKTTELPPLEHVFAEGLYFTLTDVVLLPCVHSYLAALQRRGCSKPVQLPLLRRWYLRVQEVPGVRRAAELCGIAFVGPWGLQEGAAAPGGEEPGPGPEPEPGQDRGGKTQVAFTGGPRPTMTKLKESGVSAVFSPHPCPRWTLDWDRLPAAVNPTEGKMSDVRAVRKRQQLNNLVAMVTRLASSGDTVVDFCSGGGHVGIALAHTLPDCRVVLIENKEESLVRAEARCVELGLRNVGFVQTNLDYFTGPFQIGVALHACGVATDMVMDLCIRARAAFVVSPCCYGFIQNTLKFSFPRSQKFLDILSYKEHMVLCRFADQTAVQLPPDRRLIGKQCMGLVDLDRSWRAEAHGYSVRVMTMEPDSCSPKNNMLIYIEDIKTMKEHICITDVGRWTQLQDAHSQGRQVLYASMAQ